MHGQWQVALCLVLTQHQTTTAFPVTQRVLARSVCPRDTQISHLNFSRPLSRSGTVPWTSTCKKSAKVSWKSARTASRERSTCLPWILDPLIPPSKVSPLLESGIPQALLTMGRSKDAIEALANSPENITDPKVFDVYRSYLKCAKFGVASDSEPSPVHSDIREASKGVL